MISADLRDYTRNMSRIAKTLSPQALSYVESLGPKAAPVVAAYLKASTSAQQELNGVWKLIWLKTHRPKKKN